MLDIEAEVSSKTGATGKSHYKHVNEKWREVISIIDPTSVPQSSQTLPCALARQTTTKQQDLQHVTVSQRWLMMRQQQLRTSSPGRRSAKHEGVRNHHGENKHPAAERSQFDQSHKHHERATHCQRGPADRTSGQKLVDRVGERGERERER